MVNYVRDLASYVQRTALPMREAKTKRGRILNRDGLRRGLVASLKFSSGDMAKVVAAPY